MERERERERVRRIEKGVGALRLDHEKDRERVTPTYRSLADKTRRGKKSTRDVITRL